MERTTTEKIGSGVLQIIADYPPIIFVSYLCGTELLWIKTRCPVPETVDEVLQWAAPILIGAWGSFVVLVFLGAKHTYAKTLSMSPHKLGHGRPLRGLKVDFIWSSIAALGLSMPSIALFNAAYQYIPTVLEGDSASLVIFGFGSLMMGLVLAAALMCIWCLPIVMWQKLVEIKNFHRAQKRDNTDIEAKGETSPLLGGMSNVRA